MPPGRPLAAVRLDEVQCYSAKPRPPMLPATASGTRALCTRATRAPGTATGASTPASGTRATSHRVRTAVGTVGTVGGAAAAPMDVDLKSAAADRLLPSSAAAPPVPQLGEAQSVSVSANSAAGAKGRSPPAEPPPSRSASSAATQPRGQKRAAPDSASAAGASAAKAAPKCEDCNKRVRRWGMPGDAASRWCNVCVEENRHPGAVKVKPNPDAAGAEAKTTVFCEDCNKKHAHYGEAQSKKRRWCKACVGTNGHDSAVCLTRNKLCEDCGQKQANFGTETEMRKRWCKACVTLNGRTAVNVCGHKKCEVCNTRFASYGTAQERKRRWCSTCRTQEPALSVLGSAQAVYINGVMCKDCGIRNPTYGNPNSRTREWCAGCAKANHPGAISLHAKNPKTARAKCEDCRTKYATHGLAADRRRRWCATCAKIQPGDSSPVNLNCALCKDCSQRPAKYGNGLSSGARQNKLWCSVCVASHPEATIYAQHRSVLEQSQRSDEHRKGPPDQEENDRPTSHPPDQEQDDFPTLADVDLPKGAVDGRRDSGRMLPPMLPSGVTVDSSSSGHFSRPREMCPPDQEENDRPTSHPPDQEQDDFPTLADVDLPKGAVDGRRDSGRMLPSMLPSGVTVDSSSSGHFSRPRLRNVPQVFETSNIFITPGENTTSGGDNQRSDSPPTPVSVAEPSAVRADFDASVARSQVSECEVEANATGITLGDTDPGWPPTKPQQLHEALSVVNGAYRL